MDRYPSTPENQWGTYILRNNFQELKTKSEFQKD